MTCCECTLDNLTNGGVTGEPLVARGVLFRDVFLGLLVVLDGGQGSFCLTNDTKALVLVCLGLGLVSTLGRTSAQESRVFFDFVKQGVEQIQQLVGAE